MTAGPEYFRTPEEGPEYLTGDRLSELLGEPLSEPDDRCNVGRLLDERGSGGSSKVIGGLGVSRRLSTGFCESVGRDGWETGGGETGGVIAWGWGWGCGGGADLGAASGTIGGGVGSVRVGSAAAFGAELRLRTAGAEAGAAAGAGSGATAGTTGVTGAVGSGRSKYQTPARIKSPTAKPPRIGPGFTAGPGSTGRRETPRPLPRRSSAARR